MALSAQTCYFAVLLHACLHNPTYQLPTHIYMQESEGGPALARRLVDLYFTMFRMIVEGQVGSAAEASKVQVGVGCSAV